LQCRTGLTIDNLVAAFVTAVIGLCTAEVELAAGKRHTRDEGLQSGRNQTLHVELT
jgi:hypothetical protein